MSTELVPNRPSSANIGRICAGIGPHSPKIGRRHTDVSQLPKVGSELAEFAPQWPNLSPNLPRLPQHRRSRARLDRFRRKSAEIQSELSTSTKSTSFGSTSVGCAKVGFPSPTQNLTPDNLSWRRPEARECESGPVGNIPPSSAMKLGLSFPTDPRST